MGGARTLHRLHMKDHRRWFAVVGTLALAASILTAAHAASAAPPMTAASLAVERVPASVEANGPLVQCSWLLPDVSPEAGIQYGPDDVPEIFPSEPGCSPNGPVLIGGNRHLVQVAANAGNAPAARTLELWAAVSHPKGAKRIDEVVWRIYYPDGNFKQQVAGAMLAAERCDDLGVTTVGERAAEGSMLGAAVASGQLKSPYPGTLLSVCGARRVGLFHATTSVGYAEPCGEYRVEVHAKAEGVSTVSAHQFDVVCSQQVTTDFESVSWGTLQPGSTKWLFGDKRISGAGVPTLSNRGSGGVEVGVRFWPMVAVDGEGDVISEFGAALRVAGATTVLERVVAGETVWFGTAGAICAGETARLDAAVHAPAALGAGSYQGSIDVVTRPFSSGSVCVNDLGQLGAAGGSDQRAAGTASGPRATEAFAPAAPTTTTTTTTTLPDGSSTTSEAPEGSTTTAGPEGSTTSTTEGPGATTTTTTTTTRAPDSGTTTTSTTSTTTTSTTTTSTSTTTTTTTVISPPDPDAYPIPHVLVEPLEGGGLDVTVTIQSDTTVPGSEFDFSPCLPLYDVDTNGDGVNDGDTDVDGSFEPGEAWVYSCGFGSGSGDPLPFDPGELGG